MVVRGEANDDSGVEGSGRWCQPRANHASARTLPADGSASAGGDWAAPGGGSLPWRVTRFKLETGAHDEPWAPASSSEDRSYFAVVRFSICEAGSLRRRTS